MIAAGHFLGEAAASVITSPAFEAGFELGRFVISLLP